MMSENMKHINKTTYNKIRINSSLKKSNSGLIRFYFISLKSIIYPHTFDLDYCL